MRGPYRGEGSARSVHRLRFRRVFSALGAALFCAAVTAACLAVMIDRGEVELVGAGATIVFGLGAAVLVWDLVQRLRTRITLDRDGVRAETRGALTELRWEEVQRVETFVVNEHVSHVLHGPRGERIEIHDDLVAFPELWATIDAKLASSSVSPSR